MEQYVELLKEYLDGDRTYSKKIFKVGASIFRAVENKRKTWDEIKMQLEVTV